MTDRVLVVDDEPDTRLSIAQWLEHALEGVEVVPAASAHEAQDVLARGPVGLVVSDYRMPGTDGLQFLSSMSRRAPHVPRILMTAYPDLQVAIAGLNEAHIRRFLVKPVDPDQLVAAVAELLGRRTP